MATETTLSTPQKVVEYIGYSSAALEKAAQELSQVDAQRQKVAALIPKAVEACLAHERIEPSEKQALAAALTDPVKALELLTKLAGHRNPAEQAALGAPTATVKAAGHTGRRAEPLRASDAKLFTDFGLTPPAE